MLEQVTQAGLVPTDCVLWDWPLALFYLVSGGTADLQLPGPFALGKRFKICWDTI